jgi:CO/xanthine dehydrogenase Mo-binding subunit
MRDIATTRRQFLKGTAALVVTFSIYEHQSTRAEGQPASKSVSPDQVDGFIGINRRGEATVYAGKVDLGTGVRTALAQIAAEELDVPFSMVTVIQGDTALTPDQGVTSGSLSIQNGGLQIRQAAATARQALLGMAARKLKVDASDLSVTDGTITSKATHRSVSYGALIGGKNLSLPIDKSASVKNPGDFKIVGRSVPRVDIPGKVTGQFTYMQDFRLPGMLHGRVVRPPAIGATLQSIDEESVNAIPGLIRVVRVGNFVGVVAETEWAAIQASRRLQVSWSSWQGLPDQGTLWDYVRATKIIKDDVTSDVGQVAPALSRGASRLHATYDFAIHTHGSIGPSCSVVEFENGAVTCWSASQGTHALRKQLAAMLSMPEELVRCIYIDGAGCYGRNGHEDAAGDAALLSRAVGRPVRVQWMREDEHGWDPKGPPTLIDLEASLDAKGNLLAWSSAFFLPQGAATPVALVAASLAGLPHEMNIGPGGILNDTAIPYAVPNMRTVAHRLETTPLRPAWIRAPGRMQNTFANESFVDELAMAAGADPLEFRLRHLSDARGAEVLERLRSVARWEKAAAKPRDREARTLSGRGMAFVKYELVRTYVGVVADVDLDRLTGEIRVKRFYGVQDCGQIINPDGVRNQIEGNIVQTVSRTLLEQVTFDRSRVTSLDWGSYRIIGFPEVPDVVIDLIDRPQEKPWGSGEPSASVVPAAISNAVFAAIGVRLRSVPFTPDKVKAALSRS